MDALQVPRNESASFLFQRDHKHHDTYGGQDNGDCKAGGPDFAAVMVLRFEMTRDAYQERKDGNAK